MCVCVCVCVCVCMCAYVCVYVCVCVTCRQRYVFEGGLFAEHREYNALRDYCNIEHRERSGGLIYIYIYIQHSICIQRTAYSIQHTAYSIQHTAYSIQHTACSI
jgi:hypothetical protein